VIHGVTANNVELLPWFEARGVSRQSAVGWLTAHYGPGLTPDHAEAAFAYSRCGTLHVGDRAEEALVCENAVPTSLMQVHALAVVVRNKRPVAVLDVGIGMVSMDFPDAHWLDLALAWSPDGMSAELHDRAPNGTMLVEAQSSCLEQERLMEDCEKKLAAHPNPESFARKMGHGEVFVQLDDCPLHRGKDGRIAVLRRSGMGEHSGPVKLHDCAGGRQELDSMQHEQLHAPAAERAEARQSTTYFDKACAQRGRYVWQKDRFVRAR
jgi:hypothetical protein